MAEVWRSDPLVAPDGRPWDLLVVGGGTAGLVAAHTAVELGASTLLVERDRTGGDCLWTGCVPSKSLLTAAHAAAEARGAARFGVEVGHVRVDFATVMDHVRAAVASLQPVDSPDALRDAGARVARGTVRFTGRRTAEVGGEPVAFDRAVVATGSAPVPLDVPGLDAAAPLTSDSIWGLTQLPERLLVVGGGPVGCELGQAFARLGSQVTLVDAAPRLLTREDVDAAGLVHAALVADGVDVRTGTALTGVRRGSSSRIADLRDGSSVHFDRVLVAVGRHPRTAGLGADAAGVRLGEQGHVLVDRRLRTSNPRVWAAGDVTPHLPFTHTAAVHAGIAAANAVLGLRRSVAPELIPRVTFTQPEVAAFGVSGDDVGLTRQRLGHAELDRAVTATCTDGFSELVLDRRGRIRGATVVGPRAGETLAEAVLAAAAGISTRRLAGVMHAYPTWSDGVWWAAVEHARKGLAHPVVRTGIRSAVSLRRRVSRTR